MGTAVPKAKLHATQFIGRTIENEACCLDILGPTFAYRVINGRRVGDDVSV